VARVLRLAHVVTRVLVVVSAATLVALLALVALDIVLRQFGGSSIRGSAEIAELLLPACAYLAMAYTQLHGGHVASTVVTDRLPRRLAAWVHGLGLVVATAFLAALASLAARSAWHSWEVSEERYGLLSLPLWPGRAAIALGLVGLALEVGVAAGRAFVARGPDAAGPLPGTSAPAALTHDKEVAAS
jgi:TRAP-type C4-dicarboxylate transport system permease small subunit